MSPVAVTSPSDFAPASSKEFLDIQATIECGFTLKRVRDMTRTYRHVDMLVHIKIYKTIHLCNICNGKRIINSSAVCKLMKHMEYYAINMIAMHYVKSVRIRSYSGPHFPTFGLDTERYEVKIR